MLLLLVPEDFLLHSPLGPVGHDGLNLLNGHPGKDVPALPPQGVVGFVLVQLQLGQFLPAEVLLYGQVQ